jgi:hypothetical protein
MVKTLTAKNIASIGSIRFEVDASGNLTKVEVNCEINYGELGMTQTIDLLPQLTSAQKQVAQSFYNNLKSKLEMIILG